MKKLALRVTLALVLLLLIFTNLLSQETSNFSTTGFFGNAHGQLHPAYTIERTPPWDTAKPRNTETTTGFGGGIYLGYGIFPWLSVFGGFDLAGNGEKSLDNGSVVFIYIEIGGRVNLALPGSSVVPYGTISYGEMGFEYQSQSGNVITKYGGDDGTSVAYGFGLDISGFDVNVQFSRLKFESTVTPDFNTVRINVGYTFWLSKFLDE